MIFTLENLYGIKSGAIKIAFRRWKKPRVKKGSLIKTAICQIRIEDITMVQERELTQTDAHEAGFENLDQLMAMLNDHEGDLYKIRLAYDSEDPRIALRQQSLNDELFIQLSKKLQRLDKFSKEGPWTIHVLKAISDNPKLRAVNLSKVMGMEKMKLKLNIRKLKELGLTISHEVGYEISPLGREFLRKIDCDNIVM